MKQQTAPKHRAHPTRGSRALDRTVRRERVAWFMAGKQYPSAPGKHAAEVSR